MRIPVCNTEGVIVERVDPSQARRLSLAPNAEVVRKRKGSIVRITLLEVAHDPLEEPIRGNPRVYSHNHETDWNPEKVWTLKRIPTSTRDIFRTVIDELAA